MKRGCWNEEADYCDNNHWNILVDVTNYSITYTVSGQVNHMSPDDHYADLKRLIAAVGGKARRITVIMPFLYE